MNIIELSDVDGDAVAITRQDDSTWITCTSGNEEVTVGPFSPSLLRSVLASGMLDVAQGSQSDITPAACEDAGGKLHHRTTWMKRSA